MDAALIQKCADPSLTPAIVEKFVEAAGSSDPLAITVNSGGRLLLVPKPRTPEEAMAIIRENVGRAVVRAGLTQVPIGIGVKDASELKPDLVDACENLRMGTKMFAKIMRIVAKWYGNPTEKNVQPQIFEDAVYSWKTGEFEGVKVFLAPEPEAGWRMPAAVNATDDRGQDESSEDRAKKSDEQPPAEAGTTGIRIDLSRINGN